MRVRGAAAGAALTLVLGCVACSSSGGDPDSGGRADVSNAVCVKDAAAKKVDLPSAGFPPGFPLPPGTVVYSVDNRGADQGIVVTGVTSTPFKTVLKYLQNQLPAQGFRADNGETEPHDAESDWTSNGFQGRWAIREIPQCNDETLVNVVARATS